MSNELIKIDRENALEIFTKGDKLQKYLDSVALSALNFTADVETTNGREQIKSVAYKVSKDKTAVDGIGKELVDKLKLQPKLVDEGRKKSRDFHDNLRDKIRKPVTEWEEVEKARLQAKVDAREFEEAWGSAHSEDDLFNRQKEVERKEEEFRLQEERKIEKERKAKEEEERAKREKKIALEAKEQAEKEADERIEAEKRARIEFELKTKREKEEAARQSEFDKQEALRLEREAVATREAQNREFKRKEIEKAEKKAANLKHRQAIEKFAIGSFVKCGFKKDEAENIVHFIANGKIVNVIINY